MLVPSTDFGSRRPKVRSGNDYGRYETDGWRGLAQDEDDDDDDDEPTDGCITLLPFVPVMTEVFQV